MAVPCSVSVEMLLIILNIIAKIRGVVVIKEVTGLKKSLITGIHKASRDLVKKSRELLIISSTFRITTKAILKLSIATIINKWLAVIPNRIKATNSLSNTELLSSSSTSRDLNMEMEFLLPQVPLRTTMASQVNSLNTNNLDSQLGL